MVATDSRGVDLWRVALEPPRPGMKLDGNQSLAVLADLDGDGRKEVLGAGGFKEPDAVGQAPVLRKEAYLVAPSGRILWKKWMLPKLRGAGGEEFGPGWNIHKIAVASGAGRDRVWVAVCHKLRYPGVVLELMADGSVKEVFANYGHVNSLAPLWHQGKLWLVAGGGSSALLGGFLALIDPDKGLSIAPEGGPPRYRFTTPAEAAPEVYYHVPMIDLVQGYLRDVNPVEAIEVTGSSGGWA